MIYTAAAGNVTITKLENLRFVSLGEAKSVVALLIEEAQHRLQNQSKRNIGPVYFTGNSPMFHVSISN